MLPVNEPLTSNNNLAHQPAAMKLPAILPLLAALTLHSVAQDTQAAPPVWTSADGRAIQGEFVKLAGDTLTIRNDGKEFKIPMAKLSLASREQARKLAVDAPPPAEGKPATAATPPPISADPKKGSRPNGSLSGVDAVNAIIKEHLPYWTRLQEELPKAEAAALQQKGLGAAILLMQFGKISSEMCSRLQYLMMEENLGIHVTKEAEKTQAASILLKSYLLVDGMIAAEADLAKATVKIPGAGLNEEKVAEMFLKPLEKLQKEVVKPRIAYLKSEAGAGKEAAAPEAGGGNRIVMDLEKQWIPLWAKEHQALIKSVAEADGKGDLVLVQLLMALEDTIGEIRGMAEFLVRAERIASLASGAEMTKRADSTLGKQYEVFDTLMMPNHLKSVEIAVSAQELPLELRRDISARLLEPLRRFGREVLQTRSVEINNRKNGAGPAQPSPAQPSPAQPSPAQP